MKKRLGRMLAVLGVMAMAVTGCQGLQTDAQKGGSETKTAKTEIVKKDPYADEIKIGFVPNVIGDSVAAAWASGMEEEFSVYPNISFQSFDGKASAETQNQIIADLISQKYDAILLQAADTAALAGSVEKAETAGIPVITMNLDAKTSHTALMAMVDYEAGALVAEQIASGIGEKGKVAIIQATPGATRGELLEQGFRETMKKYSGIEIVDAQTGEWLTEKANVVMNDYLTKYSDLSAVFCHNDAMAEGASQAAEAAGRLDQIQIWGADGEAKALQYIEQGKMAGTIYTNCYEMGATAARLALFSVGAQFDPASFSQTPKVKMAPIVVTKENVDSITADMRW